jgi:hypothetical protein
MLLAVVAFRAVDSDIRCMTVGKDNLANLRHRFARGFERNGEVTTVDRRKEVSAPFEPLSIDRRTAALCRDCSLWSTIEKSFRWWVSTAAVKAPVIPTYGKPPCRPTLKVRRAGTLS